MSDEKSVDLRKLNAFLGNNKGVDFRKADLLHTPNIDKYNWSGLEDEKVSLLNQLKAYQRMLRVVPEDREDLAKALLNNGIQSALQITNTPKKTFIKNSLKLFDDDIALAEQVYIRAIALRKAVTLQYMARAQHAEPHARAAGLVR
jgi:hypothetical protein